MEALGPVFVFMSIPLLFRWVPRNRLYGFRVAATLRDDVVWYDVNARAARQFLVLGSMMVILEFVLRGRSEMKSSARLAWSALLSRRS